MRLTEQNVATHSEAGVRKNNEDSFGVYVAPDNSGLLVALADGMGGHSCGEVASKRAIAVMLKMFEKYQFQDPAKLLEESIQIAHEKIRGDAAQDERMEGMGTTIVAAALVPGKVIIGHVGDSRGLQFRLPYVRRLTRDHLYATDVLDFDEAQAKHHPKGNVLSQALGIAGGVTPTLNEFEARPGDFIVLCSDGVSECVLEPSLAGALASNALPQAARAIVRAALENNSRDNCTAVIAQFPSK